MNFLLPPLEHIALVKTVSLLWNESDIRALIIRETKLIVWDDYEDFQIAQPIWNRARGMETKPRQYIENKDRNWQYIENEVIQIGQHISTPNILKERVLGLIKPIGLEIMEWLNNCVGFCLCRHMVHVYLPKMFHWTPQGRIDYKKTAEAYVTDESICTYTRYKIACQYCLENEILKLRSELSADQRESCQFKGPKNTLAHQIILYYFARTKNINIRSDLVHRQAIDQAYKSHNEEATKYLLQKLTPAKRKKILSNIVLDLSNTESFDNTHPWFLLAYLDEEQKIELHQKHFLPILSYYLKWPLQSQFMEMFKLLQKYCPYVDLYTIMKYIINPVEKGYKDYNYRELLSEFWQQMPEQKKIFFSQIICRVREFLRLLLKIRDHQNFYLILKEVSVEDLMHLFCSKSYNKAFYSNSILIQAFVSYPSKGKVQFLKLFKEHLMCGRSQKDLEKDQNQWNKLFQKFNYILINWKRSSEESQRYSVKRRRSCRIRNQNKKWTF